MIITNEDCLTILKAYFKSPDVKFVKFEIKPISENAEGFMGEHYKLLITHETFGTMSVVQFFIKTKPTKNQAQRDMVDGMGIFEREIFIYEVLLKEFDKYGLDTSFAGKSYLCKDKTTIIMEDLTTKGFELTDRHTALDLNSIKSALHSLALYHAAGFAYEKIKREELGEEFVLGAYCDGAMDEKFFIQYIDQTSYSMKWWNSTYKTIHALIEIIPEENDFKKRFRTLYDNFKIGKCFIESTDIAKTCGHGDLWSNNMLFKKSENNEIPKCSLVDFQVCRYFYPSFDVILAIFGNSDHEFRERHLDDLLKFYYDALAGTLNKYGYKTDLILSWDDFINSYNLVLADALIQVVMTNCIVFLPKQKLTNFVKEDQEGLNELIFDNADMTVQAFNTDNSYRKLITEGIFDLYNAMLRQAINSKAN